MEWYNGNKRAEEKPWEKSKRSTLALRFSQTLPRKKDSWQLHCLLITLVTQIPFADQKEHRLLKRQTTNFIWTSGYIQYLSLTFFILAEK